MNNFQQHAYAQKTYTTEYAGAPALGVDVVATDYVTGTGFINTTNTEFVFGFETRAEAAYQVTKYIGLRAGIEVIDFAQGIWRGANPGFGNVAVQDQNVLLAGFTFGFEVNR